MYTDIYQRGKDSVKEIIVCPLPPDYSNMPSTVNWHVE